MTNECSIISHRIFVFNKRDKFCLDKFHKIFREKTGLELQIRGLYTHGNDSMNRVRDFLGHYTIRDAEEIILWFPDTLREHIHKITYDGEDIFRDEGVRNYIDNDDAVVIGFTVQIEYSGYNFRVKVGSNSNMGYVSIKTRTRLREASDLASDLVEKYRNHFL